MNENRNIAFKFHPQKAISLKFHKTLLNLTNRK